MFRTLAKTTMTMAAFSLFLGAGCSDDGDDTTTSVGDTSAPSDATPDATPDAAPDAVADTSEDSTPDGVATVVYTKPSYFPDEGSEADLVVPMADLSGSVRVIYDSRGVPHIFGDSLEDIAFVQGYVTARDRIFQMHTLRMATAGRLAELLGVSSFSGDMVLRNIGLARTAKLMTDRAQANFPEYYKALSAFAAGTNALVDRIRSGEETAPIEFPILNVLADWEPWTVEDTMKIVRLQTWDLSFDGDADLRNLQTIIGLKDRFDGTALEGLEEDWANWSPTIKIATEEPAGGAATSGIYDLSGSIDQAFFAQVTPPVMEQVLRPLTQLETIPHHAFRGPDFGSNNWVVSGDHTASGKPMVVNDPHLALRNPSVFYHVHISNTLAGGKVNASGVNFAGAPGIVLGHNDHVAWAATVVASDVTDVYLEKLSEDGTQVWFQDAWVDLDMRDEVFKFHTSSDKTCVELGPSWLSMVNPRETREGSLCTVTVTFPVVPHHGPIIPWSFADNADGDPIAFSWKWTGMKPTDDFPGIFGLNFASSVAEMKASLDNFSVGAQNWIMADTAGTIAWYPTHQLPIRENIASGDTTYPPFLPMPGDGGAEWSGFIPRSELPQVENPSRGWIATANQDPVGTMYDNDPFNDGHYLGYNWAGGFRQNRVVRRLTAAVAAGDITIADMQSIQADHTSNVGTIWTTHLIDAIDAAKASDDATLSGLVSAEVEAARALLSGWEALGYAAASGVGAPAGSDEAKASAAAAIFNAWLVFVIDRAIGDEGLQVGGQGEPVLSRMLLSPQTMTTYDADTGESRLWDNVETADVVETKTFVMVKSLAEALAFLGSTDAVGPLERGGFGTSDMSEWRWGALHTLTLRHNISPDFNMPPTTEMPGGFPRPCDNFCVDASHPGTGFSRCLHDGGNDECISFTFSSGASTRQVMELISPVVRHSVIPGGQSEHPLNPAGNYSDEMSLWVKNEAPQVFFTVSDIISDKASVVDFVAPADQP